MAHDHHHGHHAGCRHVLPVSGAGGPRVERGSERTRLVWALGLTSAVLLLEVVGGLAARSLALLSDAGHMLTDAVAQGLSLAALLLAARPADARRTYGWYRLEILAALLNGLTLIFLSGGIFWSAAGRLRSPVEVHTGLMLAIAAVGLAVNLVGVRLLHGAESLNVRGAYLHLVFDLLSSVVVVGGGLVMAATRGLYWLDPLLSIAIGLFVLYSAFRLVREAVDVLLETVPRGIDPAGVSGAIRRLDGIADVHDLHIWTITSGLYALSAHVVVAGGHSHENDAIMNRIKQVLLAEFAIGHTTLQLESEDYEHVGDVC